MLSGLALWDSRPRLSSGLDRRGRLSQQARRQQGRLSHQARPGRTASAGSWMIPAPPVRAAFPSRVDAALEPDRPRPICRDLGTSDRPAGSLPTASVGHSRASPASPIQKLLDSPPRVDESIRAALPNLCYNYSQFVENPDSLSPPSPRALSRRRTASRSPNELQNGQNVKLISLLLPDLQSDVSPVGKRPPIVLTTSRSRPGRVAWPFPCRLGPFAAGRRRDQKNRGSTRIFWVITGPVMVNNECDNDPSWTSPTQDWPRFSLAMNGFPVRNRSTDRTNFKIGNIPILNVEFPRIYVTALLAHSPRLSHDPSASLRIVAA